MSNWESRLKGRFIVFDGPDGSGKSTQFARFAERVRGAGVEVCEVREPGGTSIGEQVRAILLDPANAEMSVRCEMLLYMASRAQLIEQTIRPARVAGQLVLADRFLSSTLAYQGTAGGLPPDEIQAVGRVVVGEDRPDLTVIFDVDDDTAADRLDPEKDRMEQKGRAFHRQVRAGFLQQATDEPDRYAVIDATVDADRVFADLCSRLEKAVAAFPTAVRS
jgi:dTMP kinase